MEVRLIECKRNSCSLHTLLEVPFVRQAIARAGMKPCTLRGSLSDSSAGVASRVQSTPLQPTATTTQGPRGREIVPFASLVRQQEQKGSGGESQARQIRSLTRHALVGSIGNRPLCLDAGCSEGPEQVLAGCLEKRIRGMAVLSVYTPEHVKRAGRVRLYAKQAKPQQRVRLHGRIIGLKGTLLAVTLGQINGLLHTRQLRGMLPRPAQAFLIPAPDLLKIAAHLCQSLWKLKRLYPVQQSCDL
jgi:hypothetical protein